MMGYCRAADNFFEFLLSPKHDQYNSMHNVCHTRCVYVFSECVFSKSFFPNCISKSVFSESMFIQSVFLRNVSNLRVF